MKAGELQRAMSLLWFLPSRHHDLALSNTMATRAYSHVYPKFSACLER